MISAFLARGALSATRWSATNLVVDSSEGTFVNAELLGYFPDQLHSLAGRPSGIDSPGDRLWFVGPRARSERFAISQPAFAVDTGTGRLWRQGSDDGIDLMAVYRQRGRSLDALVSAVCPRAF